MLKSERFSTLEESPQLQYLMSAISVDKVINFNQHM